MYEKRQQFENKKVFLLLYLLYEDSRVIMERSFLESIYSPSYGYIYSPQCQWNKAETFFKYRVRHMFRDKQFRSCSLGKYVFLKTFFTKFVATYPSYKKYIRNFHHRFMVKNLEFQIYTEKMLERPWSLFMQKRLYSIGLHIVFRTKCT